MAVTLSNEDVAASPMGAGGPPRVSQIEPTGRGLAEKAAGVAAGLVKGAGQVRGNRGATGYNLDESVHGGEIFTKAHDTHHSRQGRGARPAGATATVSPTRFSRDFTSNREFIARTGGLSRLKNDARSARRSPPPTWGFRAFRTVLSHLTSWHLRV